MSTEAEIKDNEMELIRKMIRRLDISDVESEELEKKSNKIYIQRVGTEEA